MGEGERTGQISLWLPGAKDALLFRVFPFWMCSFQRTLRRDKIPLMFSIAAGKHALPTILEYTGSTDSSPGCGTQIWFCKDNPNDLANQIPLLHWESRCRSPRGGIGRWGVHLPLYSNVGGWDLEGQADAEEWGYCSPTPVHRRTTAVSQHKGFLALNISHIKPFFWFKSIENNSPGVRSSALTFSS